MVLHQVHDCVDAAVAGRLRRAEVGAHRQNMPLCHLAGAVDQLGHALILQRTDGNDGNAQLAAHLIDINRTAARAYLIHHVQRQHHRYIQLQKLHGEVQVAFNIGGIGDIDDAIRLFAQNIFAGDDLLLRIGAQGIDARQVYDRAVALCAHGADLLLHRHAREVADMAVHASEHIKQCGLTAVLVSGECKSHRCTSPAAAAGTGSTVIFAASSRRMVSS